MCMKIPFLMDVLADISLYRHILNQWRKVIKHKWQKSSSNWSGVQLGWQIKDCYYSDLCQYSDVSIMMSQWCLKSPASPLFTQPFSQPQIKENNKAPRYWPRAGNSPVTGEFPAQRASNAENVSIWWRHHTPASPLNVKSFVQPFVHANNNARSVSKSWRHHNYKGLNIRFPTKLS